MKTAARRWMVWTAAALCCGLLATACDSDNDGPSDEAAEESEDEGGVETSGGGGSAVSGFLSGEFTGAQLGTGTPLPGLSVSHTATATIPADRAVVVVESTGGGILGADSGLSSEDRTAVLDAAGAAGLPPESVTFGGQGTFGGPRIDAVVPVPDVGTAGRQFVDAVQRVVGRTELTGVIFGLSDCGAALAPLRREAFTGAEAKAKDLAETGSLRLGPVVSLAQQSTSGGETFSPVPPDPCDPSPRRDGPGSDLQPLDAPPEVRVSLTLYATWGLANQQPAPPGRSELSATGRGTASTKADEAYVVVVIYDEDGEGEAPSGEDRDRTTTAIARLGVDRDDIEIATGSAYGPVTVVQVELPLRDVEDKGPEIEEAVEDVLGRPYASGVRFWHSDCQDLLGRARKAAVADARARATGLAEASGTRLGDLQAVAEAPSYPFLDPCDDGAHALIALDDYTAAVQPFDGEGEFKVETGVRLSFALAP